jgi:hypothetical protein
MNSGIAAGEASAVTIIEKNGRDKNFIMNSLSVI